jgi:23S rRNA pseudouridine955/2504/2580 synthase/23S rRNA pseudouridine1911/1915/1917 synthase
MAHINLSSIILFENKNFVVLNKPAGMLSIPDRTQSEPSLKDMLKEKYGDIFTVHRLDKGTSGVIIFAKDEATHKSLSQVFESRDVEKIYHGLVLGNVSPPSGDIAEPIAEHPAKNGKMIIHTKGKPSLTSYEVLQIFRQFTWMKFQIHTGRTHQIRVHMQHFMHPIVCDDTYGNGEPVYLSKIKRRYNLSKKQDDEQPILARLALHSSSLKFTLPGKEFLFEAPLPKDLRALLQQLNKN